FAIATPAAQAAYNLTKQIPILFTAVTDPVKAELVESMEKSNTNVTGTSDELPLDKQFDLIKKLIPNAKKIGILYNTSEINSELQVKKATDLAKEKGFEIISLGVNSSNDMSQGLANILQKVD
ncbi:ABC transporter substrate-binding protein, partial [Clostridium perfringens]